MKYSLFETLQINRRVAINLCYSFSSAVYCSSGKHYRAARAEANRLVTASGLDPGVWCRGRPGVPKLRLACRGEGKPTRRSEWYDRVRPVTEFCMLSCCPPSVSRHSSNQNTAGRAKECLSVFGLRLRRCVSSSRGDQAKLNKLYETRVAWSARCMFA